MAGTASAKLRGAAGRQGVAKIHFSKSEKCKIIDINIDGFFECRLVFALDDA